MTDVQKLFVSVNNISTVLNDIKETVEHDHKLLVEGNGDVPLVQKVRELQEFVNTFKFWQRTIAVALVLQVIGTFILLLVTFIRVYPALEILITK